MLNKDETASAPLRQPAGAPRSNVAAFPTILRSLWKSEARTRVLLLAIGIAVVIVVTAMTQVRLNAWNRPFYDAIEHKDVQTFLDQLLVFAAIVCVLLVLNVTQTWLHQTMRLTLRSGLTRDMIANWLTDKRAFRITRIGDIGANPDQRIHQDGQHLTDLSTDLGVGLFQASLLLVSFVGVLWGLSSGIVIPFNGEDYTIPGYMVWCALLYAATGSWLSWRVGRRLVPLNAEHYAREADFRAALVRTHEHADGIALYGYELEERRHLFGNFDAVVEIVRRIIMANVRLTWVTAGYGWLALVVPIVVASPGYFTGKLTFGELMVVVGAFYQVQQALRWFVDNAGPIADWRATVFRVMSFRDALVALDQLERDGDRVVIEDDPAGHLRFDGLTVATPAGPAHLREGDVAVEPGERVLILGKPGCGKTTLFLAIAGIAPAGSGRILLPPQEKMAFLSQIPYVPPGSLRDALALSVPGVQTDTARIEALRRVGLDHLADSLDRVARWDRELTISEQHRLVSARLILAKPGWVISDSAIDVLDEEGCDTIRSIFEKELAGSSVLSLSQTPSEDGFYRRFLHLVGPEPAATVKGAPARHSTPALRPVAPAPEPNIPPIAPP